MTLHQNCPYGFLRRPSRGSVILFVLGVVLLTAFLLTRLIDRAGGELLAETKAANRANLRDQAYSALEVTLAVLADFTANDGALYSAQQGWDKPLEYAGYLPPPGFDASVSFEDETGKLSLATVNEAVLQHYLETIGASVSEAERLTDAILAWTRKDYLASSSDADPRNYENSPFPYEPPKRAIRTFEELRAINVVNKLFFDEEGRWSELGNKFKNDVSLFEFNSVNVNSARSAALVGLGVDAAQASVLGDELNAKKDPTREGKFYRSVGEVVAAHGGAFGQAGLGAEIACLRVNVTMKQGSRVFILEAVIQPGTGGAVQNTNAAAEVPSDDPSSPPPTPVDPRELTRKSIDYPFRILELRETDGPF